MLEGTSDPRFGVLKTAVARARKLGSGQIARASMVSMAITVAGLALGFAQAVLTARLLGASNYGMVAVPMAIVQILSLLTLSGYGGLAIREVPARLAAGDRGGVTALLRHAFVVVLGLSVAAAALIAIVASSTTLVPAAYRPSLEIGGLLVIPIAVSGLLSSSARGFGRTVQAQAPGDLARPTAMLFLLGSAAVLGLGLGPVDYMWLSLGAALIWLFSAAVWFWRSEHSNLRAPPRSGRGAGYFVAALSFLGIDLTLMFQAQINTLLLGWLASPQQTGLFQPIVRLAPVFMLPVHAASIRFAPRIAELWESGDLARIRSVTRAFTWTTSLLTFSIAVTTAAVGPWLMPVFGAEFRQTAPLLWYIAAAQIFNAGCGPVGMLLTMSGRSGATLGGHVAGFAVNALFGALLIPKYGALGAVMAMSLGIAVWNIAILVMVRSRYKFNPSLIGFLR
jgi:O-antigen/teichoic acid export membrane protein